jgi:hypothetical protein
VRGIRGVDALAAARTIVTMLNEVAVGMRPARVICPLFAVHLRERVRRTRPHPGPVPGVRRLVISTTADGAYEVVAVSHRAGRFAAISLRLVDAGHGWVVTDLARPAIPSGHTAPPLSDPPSARASTGKHHG